MLNPRRRRRLCEGPHTGLPCPLYADPFCSSGVASAFSSWHSYVEGVANGRVAFRWYQERGAPVVGLLSRRLRLGWVRGAPFSLLSSMESFCKYRPASPQHPCLEQSRARAGGPARRPAAATPSLL